MSTTKEVVMEYQSVQPQSSEQPNHIKETVTPIPPSVEASSSKHKRPTPSTLEGGPPDEGKIINKPGDGSGGTSSDSSNGSSHRGSGAEISSVKRRPKDECLSGDLTSGVSKRTLCPATAASVEWQAGISATRLFLSCLPHDVTIDEVRGLLRPFLQEEKDIGETSCTIEFDVVTGSASRILKIARVDFGAGKPDFDAVAVGADAPPADGAVITAPCAPQDKIVSSEGQVNSLAPGKDAADAALTPDERAFRCYQWINEFSPQIRKCVISAHQTMQDARSQALRRLADEFAAKDATSAITPAVGGEAASLAANGPSLESSESRVSGGGTSPGDLRKRTSDSRPRRASGGLVEPSQPSADGGGEYRVLLVSITDLRYPVDIDILHRLFSVHGTVEKVVTFVKQGSQKLQAFVQMADISHASRAAEALNDKCIYDGCNKLQIQTSKLRNLVVKQNNCRSWDFTIAPPPTRAQLTEMAAVEMRNAAAAAAASSGVAAGLGGMPIGGTLGLLAPGGTGAPGPATSPGGYMQQQNPGPHPQQQAASPTHMGGLHQRAAAHHSHSGHQGDMMQQHQQQHLQQHIQMHHQQMHLGPQMINSNQGAGLVGSGGAGGQWGSNFGGPMISNTVGGIQGQTSQPQSAQRLLMVPHVVEKLPRELQNMQIHQQINPLQTPVVILYKLPVQDITVTKLFNLLSIYGFVVRIKLLRGKPDSALCQFSDPLYATLACHYLLNAPMFGTDSPLHIGASKNSEVTIPANDDGRTATYTAKDQRADDPEKFLRSVCKPTPTLFLANLHENATREAITGLLAPFGNVLRVDMRPPKMGARRLTAIAQMGSEREALTALCHLHNQSFMDCNVKLAFSKQILLR